jgi:hypothetical protein
MTRPHVLLAVLVLVVLASLGTCVLRQPRLRGDTRRS